MLRVCQAPGCTKLAASRYARFCSAHKIRNRRHGDAAREAVSAADLAPFVRRVEARVAKNADSPVWATLEQRWGLLVGHAQRLAAQTQAMNKYERQAAHEVIKLARDVEPRAAIHTVLAMFLMQGHNPRRFRSDAAFRAQLVRRVSALTDKNVGTWWDYKAKKVKRVYRDLPIKTVEILGQWLAETAGGAGVHLTRLERADEEKQREEVLRYRQALGELT